VRGSAPLLKESVKVHTVTTATFDSELKLTNKHLIALLRYAGYEVSDDAKFQVAGATDSYGAAVLVDDEVTLDVTWKTVHKTEREE
jgi:hypothetical protein